MIINLLIHAMIYCTYDFLLSSSQIELTDRYGFSAWQEPSINIATNIIFKNPNENNISTEKIDIFSSTKNPTVMTKNMSFILYLFRQKNIFACYMFS